MKNTILLVDDSLTQLTSLKITLTKLGYNVITASNGIDGIFAAYQDLPDVIISDIIMPEIDGYQFCRLLKNDDLTKHIPIILLSQLNQKIDKFWGLRSGADAFLTKDSNIVNLQSIINKLFENVSTISDTDKQNLISERKALTSNSIQSKIKQIFDQTLIESTIINEFRTLSEHILNTKTLSNEIISLISSIIDFNVIGIFFKDRDDNKEKTVFLGVNNVSMDDNILNDLKKDVFSSLFNRYSDNDNSYSYKIIENIANELNIVNAITDFKSKTIIPITYSDKLLGAICIYHSQANKFFSSKILDIVLEELKILMRMKWLYSETKYLTIIDSLTGLYNRRYFQQSIEREFSRAKRYGNHLTIAMIDLDFFKKINDQYGHQFGDKVLVDVATIFKDSLRRTDYISRYGGEEFVLILPETDKENAYIPLERIRQKISEIPIYFENKPVTVTVSIGIANYCREHNDSDALIKSADVALYKAKESGRNKVLFL